MADDKDDGKEDAVNMDSQLLEETKARQSNVELLLAKKDVIGAICLAINNPPVFAKSSEIKDLNGAIVEKALSQLPDSDIPRLLERLDADSCDFLMKYVYKCMGKSFNCSQMLKLHSQLSDKCGLGCIVRTMTDRKQV